MKNDLVRQIALILTTLFTLVMNSLANALPLNGRGTGEISDSFNVLFVPAGYVFSIWGIIYIGLIAYTIYHSLPKQAGNPRLRRTGWLVALTSLANGGWNYFWHFGYYAVTVLVMFVLLAALIAIYLRLDIGRTPFSKLEKWVVSIPISLYLGWISVATIANITALLSYLGWDRWGLSELAWTLIMLGIGVALGGVMAFVRRDIAYSLVLVWAFTGISVRWMAMPVLNSAGYCAAALVLIFLVVSRMKPPQSQRIFGA
ncbi:MAG: tryptophan-rich sensory protein [Anaerolineaceae bacterium]